MRNDDMHLVDLALRFRMITEQQVKIIKDELQMFPGQNAGKLMVRRGILTDEQLAQVTKLGEAQGRVAAALKPGAAPAAAGPDGGAAGAEMRAAAPEAPPQPGLRAAPPSPPPGAFPGAHPGAPAGAPPPGPGMRPLAPGAPAAELEPAEPPETRPPAETHIEPGSSEFPPKGRIDFNTLPELLAMARKWECSDVHVSSGLAPVVRRFGEVHYLTLGRLTAEHSEELNFSMLTPVQADRARKDLQLDYALEVPGVGRHRCSMFHQRLGWDANYRIIPSKVTSFEALGLPEALKTLTEYHQGLILVTGPAGSGKTTTVAAMVDLINRTRTDHIITVEDPIEYVLKPAGCQVTHREVGPHTQSFANALRGALREDPDIILVGELRDLDTISIAISAAETGHLVFGTLHTNSAARTVARIMDVYPPEQREQICTMVSESTRGVVSQLLVPRKDGRGRALALEVLVFTSAVSAQIREGKTHLLTSLMQSGKKSGMKVMEDSLMELFQAGTITGRVAYQYALNKTPFEAIKDR